ncbi:nuclear transport factor 2 family protein [Streptomyces sp. S.PB5]|uniref:nuclear transport factor 2 family protein n=1 Tax=Streptomyces sp. S.PB5 TaxID=3020844 RepID=UPI0025B04CA3|nr:nuclear transport factor 2 family protein [Streptomyces sp. S.PB5]MDN3028568.1 nuclear transport factor 2 family protein [Streptomyces sp. S.PB5]
MTDIQQLPEALRIFIDATNAGDSEAFVAAFSPDAHLNDWGHEFHGRSGVAQWNRSDNIGVQAHFDLVSAAPGPQDGTYRLTLKVSGNGYNGTGPMVFELRDGLIASLRIS